MTDLRLSAIAIIAGATTATLGVAVTLLNLAAGCARAAVADDIDPQLRITWACVALVLVGIVVGGVGWLVNQAPKWLGERQ